MFINRNFPTLFPLCLVICLLLTSVCKDASAFNLNESVKGIASIAAAYSTHLFFHEMGHQVVADDVGAKNHKISFFTTKNGNFYPGLSTYQSIPEESLLPYAAGGDRMAGYTFEFALESYRHKPTAFNKALMLFSCADFLVYTVMANYLKPDHDMYDPNIIRAETGCSKEILLGMVTAKTLLNAYRIFDKDVYFAPCIWADRHSAGLMIKFKL